MMLDGIERLAADPGTEVIVLISKPPAASVARRVLAAAAAAGKPVIVNFLGGDPAAVARRRRPSPPPRSKTRPRSPSAIALGTPRRDRRDGRPIDERRARPR